MDYSRCTIIQTDNSPEPTVSTPVSWAEVGRCLEAGSAEMLRFTAQQVLERVDKLGDLFAPVLNLHQPLPKAVEVEATAPRMATHAETAAAARVETKAARKAAKAAQAAAADAEAAVAKAAVGKAKPARAARGPAARGRRSA